MNNFEIAFSNWVIRYRWWLTAATLFAVLLTASGMRFLTFDNDFRVFFSEKNPQLQALETLEKTYSKIDNVYIVVAPQDKNVFTRENLTVIEKLTEACWQIPYSSRVASITNFQHTYSEEDDLIVEDLVLDALSMSDAEISRAREVALSEPRLVNNTVSSNGQVTGINVNVMPPGKSMDEIQQIAGYTRKLLDDFRQNNPAIDLYLTGSVMFDNAFTEATKDDLKTLIPLMFLMLVIIVGITLRTYTGTLVTFIVILFSMATGMGMAGWLGIAMTTASGIAPTIIMTLAVADSVHILATVYQQIGMGVAKQQAIKESMRINLQPIFLTSITTAIGFLTMNFSDAPPFRDLGNIVAMGIVAAFVYSVLFLPAMLMVLPIRSTRKITASHEYHFSCNRLADFIIRNRQAVFWTMTAVVVLLISGVARLELNDNFLKYFSTKYDIRRSTDFMLANLRGWDIIEYSLESGEPSGINNPEYLSKVEEFAEWYRKQPKITYVSSYTNTIKALNKNMHNDDPAYYKVPETRDLAAQYMLLYEMSVPFGHDLNNQINVDKSATRMIVFLEATTAKDQRAMDAKARQWLKDNAPPHMFTYGSGLSIIWAHISKRNIESMLGASFGALVLISAILILALKSFRIGLISLIPNLAPAFMSFGVWGMLVGQVGLSVSVIVSLTLGIVVDDTIHFLSKYLRARREKKLPPTEAVRYAFNTVGTAMWVTTLALVTGFIILSFSGFAVNAQMGLLSAITISLALLLDFFFLPALLMKVDSKKSQA
jgi:predicted RND superfamily exporter protein